jgi:uracil-DNA glycosylase
MQSGSAKQNPVRYKIPGTNLIYDSHTGHADWSRCNRCLLATGRRIVAVRRDGHHDYGRTPRTRIMFIGDSPDRTDSNTGIPFTGRAGRVLEFIISELRHSISYCMTHTVCCETKDIVRLYKPDGTEYLSTEQDEANNFLSTPGTYADVINQGRPPSAKEVQLCSDHIVELLDSFKPQGVVYVGTSVRRNQVVSQRYTTHTLFRVPMFKFLEEEYKLLECRREAHKLESYIRSVTPGELSQ